jgi:transposase
MSKTLRLQNAEIAEVIDERHREEPDGWKKTRLLAVKLAAKGEYRAEQVAELCGVVRSRVFAWIKCARKEGLEALLTREKPGPQKGAYRGVKPEVIKELNQALEAGKFANAEQARRWLKKEHEVERPYKTVWGWIKKAGGVLRVPRPSHSKKDPQAAGQFKNQLVEKFEALGIPAGSLVKVWYMDEARFGLHTEMRRVWTKKGLRPVFSKQIKYEWDYLYGALSVVGGEAHFAHIPSVSLEWDRSYLQDLAESDPDAVHVLLRDQAGFHLRDGDERLPERVRIVDLPPYNPELNPCEQMWDIVKDDTCNQIFPSIAALRERIGGTLQRFWDDAQSVIRLIGRDWFLLQLNAMPKTRESL